ncbi:radical SAM protein [Clostridium sardiniense]|uniref:radical SAM protein n=1 Tax=Clostridium sardiniense TaxID=29369 RepID=UPI00195A2FF2|nr:radical SAM protein [Clostridium sardiniense]MBM7836236.1 MoaA/NifB/PqqE/SkfB family radical SAM enzyme [Clostridium sardiniense]
MRIDSIHWEITSKCNLNCRHCFVDKTVNEIKDLPFEESIKIIKRLAGLGVKKITFSTKEPLIYKNISELINLCNKYGIITDMVTNGILLEDIEFAKKIMSTSLSAIFISIEGITKESNDYIRGKGSFNKIIRAIKNVRRVSNKHLGIQMTLNKYNMKEVDKIPQFFNELNINSLNIGGIASQGNALENLEIQITDEEFRKSQEEIVKAYNSLKNKKYQLNLKSALPIEVAYLNLKTGSNFFTYVPKCSVINNCYSLMSNGKIIPCISMFSSKVFKDKMFEIDLDNEFLILDNTKFNKEVKSYINIQKRGICDNCNFNDECFPCVMTFEGKDSGKTMNKCEIMFSKFEDLLENIIKNKELYNVMLNENMIFINNENNYKFKRYDLSNNMLIKTYSCEDIPIEIINQLYKDKISLNKFEYLLKGKLGLKKILAKLIMDSLIKIEEVENV